MSSRNICFPTDRQYPIDKVIEEIVRALAERDWSVPEISVKFDISHKHGKHVDRISGKDVYLWFCRCYQDSVNAMEIIIPGYQLSLFADWSGPVLRYYVGSDWKRDAAWWFAVRAKVNSKLHREDRGYLMYSGSRARSNTLVSDTDLGREYAPIEGIDPESFDFIKLQQFMENWLRENILTHIQSFPVSK